MPVYLDRALPYHDRWLDPATAPPGPNREFDIEKYWWGYKMASLGFKTLCALLGGVLVAVRGMRLWGKRS